MTTTLNKFLGHTPRPYLERARAYPFIKWAGGKRSLIPEIAKRLPETLDTYWEPFLGGGAVFFALDSRISKARLSDVNAELALTYQIVKKRTDELIDTLARHAENHDDPKYYYEVRDASNNADPVVVAARFVYLNKTCYNGLYRVNKKGKFNVPRGSYKKPTICDADNLRAVSDVLTKATIRYDDFSDIGPDADDFVYCDPPYDGTFANYDASGFGDADQQRLRDAAIKWHTQGVNVMLSNSDTPLIRQLYADSPFVLHQVNAPRQINCKGNGRKPVDELLITTYPCQSE